LLRVGALKGLVGASWADQRSWRFVDILQTREHQLDFPQKAFGLLVKCLAFLSLRLLQQLTGQILVLEENT